MGLALCGLPVYNSGVQDQNEDTTLKFNENGTPAWKFPPRQVMVNVNAITGIEEIAAEPRDTYSCTRLHMVGGIHHDIQGSIPQVLASFQMLSQQVQQEDARQQVAIAPATMPLPIPPRMAAAERRNRR
jgi:hypothetical protein